MIPSIGQIWQSERNTYYFITGLRLNKPEYPDWVYCDNMNEVCATSTSMEWFLKYCKLVSG